MRLKNLLVFGLFFLLFLSFCPSTHAYLQKVNFDVWTTNYNDHKELNVWIEPFHCTSKNPPDFVKSITITAPDGTVFTLDTVNNWMGYDRGYWGKYLPEHFNSGDIPSGDYSVSVEGIEFDLVINESDNNDGSVLDPPAFTNLTNNDTDVPKDYIFNWTPVSGATYYRVLIWNEDWNEPVYWFWDRQFRTNHAACKFSSGDLKPNTLYKIRIEARGGSQDLDKRSRTDWINFTTSSW